MLLTQAVMAENLFLRMRVAACAAQEGCANDKGIDPDEWSRQWRKIWASAEGWDTKWEEAQDALEPQSMPQSGASPIGPVPIEVTDIGQDPDVITDQMIRNQVEAMKPFTYVEDHKPEMNPAMMASRQFVSEMLDPTNRTIGALMKALVDLRGGKEIVVPPPPPS